MKKLVLALVAVAMSPAFAAKVTFAGSDTLAGAIGDAIIQAGMDSQLQYTGGGSGVGEKGLINGDQGIAPMSREITQAALDQLAVKSQTVTPLVLALDGLSIFVKGTNPVPSLDLPTLVKIYTCEYTKWEQIPGSKVTGALRVYRRNDSSGTTDAFKHFTGLKAFGACVQVVNETADISDVTSRDPLALGYSGLSGTTANNRPVAIAARAGAPAVLPTTATVRDFSYPMARKLFVYVVSGARTPNAVENDFLNYISDRSFMDPIMQSHDFITID